MVDIARVLSEQVLLYMCYFLDRVVALMYKYKVVPCRRQRSPDSFKDPYVMELPSRSSFNKLTHADACGVCIQRENVMRREDVAPYEMTSWVQAVYAFFRALLATVLMRRAYELTASNGSFKERVRDTLRRLRKVEGRVRNSPKFMEASPTLERILQDLEKAIATGVDDAEAPAMPSALTDWAVTFYTVVDGIQRHWQCDGERTSATEMNLLSNYISGHVGGDVLSFFTTSGEDERAAWAADVVLCETVRCMLMKRGGDSVGVAELDTTPQQIVGRMVKKGQLHAVCKVFDGMRCMEDKNVDCALMMYDMSMTGSLELSTTIKQWDVVSAVYWLLGQRELGLIDALRLDVIGGRVTDISGAPRETEHQKACLLPLAVLGLVRVEGRGAGLFKPRVDCAHAATLQLEDGRLAGRVLAELGFREGRSRRGRVIGVPHTKIAYIAGRGNGPRTPVVQLKNFEMPVGRPLRPDEVFG